MLTRRIAASACALCLAVPAAAAAKDVRYVGHVTTTAVAVVATGDTKNDLPGTAYRRPSPATPRADLPRAIAPAPRRTTRPWRRTAGRAQPAPSRTTARDGWQLAALDRGRPPRRRRARRRRRR